MTSGYGSYRTSTIPWIDVLPAHWETKPLLAVARERDVRNTGMTEDNLLSLSYGNIIRKDITSNEGLLPESFETYQIVEPNDVVFRLTDLQNDKRSLRTGQVRERGIITSAYLAVEPTAILPDYLGYLLRAYDLTKVFYSMGGGLRQSMKYGDIRRMPMVVPPPPEQGAIAAFLDHETGKIDALVEEQRRLIDLLKEKRQAIISHAITKGLDPNAKMKPSGVEWLGDVPEHWPVSKLGRFLSILSGFAFPSTGFSTSEDGVRLLRGINVAVGRVRWDDVVYWQREVGDGLDRFELKEGQVLVGMDRPWIAEGMRVARVTASDVPSLLLQRVTAISAKDGMVDDFVHLLLSSQNFVAYFTPDMTGVSVPHLSPEQITLFEVAVPPIAEQIGMVTFVSDETREIEALLDETQKALELLVERRSALISAAVTGKIDVRAVVTKCKTAA